MPRIAAFTCRLFACIVIILGLSWGGPVPIAFGHDGAEAPPRYVFLFIGDGMGFGQVEVTDLAQRAKSNEPLRMSRLPVQGRIQTRSANQPITDSAAAATALASGSKTNNYIVGKSPAREPVRPITYDFIDAGRRVGILTSVPVNHATPAAFYAHANHRNHYHQIAEQFAGSGVHLLVGRSLTSEHNRQDEVVSAWRSSGVAVVESLADAATVPADTRLVVLADTLADPALEQGQLADAVDLAIDRLGGDAGFFMMVEGGGIDWRGHNSEGWELVLETLAFDRAIERAYRFYQQHPDETLIIVTADHETGGMIVDAERIDLSALGKVPAQRTAVRNALKGDPEAITLPLAERAIVDALGIPALPDEDQAALADAVNRQAKDRLKAVLTVTKRIADRRAGVAWTAGGHTDADVPIMAIGVGSQHFEGSFDNTEIARRLRELCFPASLAHPSSSRSAIR